MLFNSESLYTLSGIKVDKLFFFSTSHMNSNNNIDTGLSVGRSAGGKPDSALNKLKTRQNDDMK